MSIELELIRAYRRYLEHLQGKHDQKSHGRRGGGSTKKIGQVQVKEKPSLSDYISIYQWNKAGQKVSQPVVNDASLLPPPKEGTTRIFHGTAAKNAGSISNHGVLTSSGKKENLPVIMGIAGDKVKGSSEFGEVSIVADVPSADVRQVNKEGWVEVRRSIKPEEITGVVLGKMPVTMDQLRPIVKDYERIK